MARKRAVPLLMAALAVSGGAAVVSSAAAGASASPPKPSPTFGSGPGSTRTPIKHVVVIFQENVSFDHYFGTYPNAANTDGQPFTAAPGTPAVDGLTPATSPSIPFPLQHTSDLTTTNPNAALPQRLDSSATGATAGQGQLTCDQDHNYSDEQKAVDQFKTDLYVQSVGNGHGNGPTGTPCNANQVMDYYDGNTVTALWNYAQQYAMSDDSYGTTYGPSSPGAINLVAGSTGSVDMSHTANSPSIATSTAPNADLTPDGLGGYSLTSDAQPYWDDCSTRDAVALNGQNIGDELNAAGLSWGWFEGGLAPSTSYAAALQALNISQGTSTFVPDQFKSAFATGGPLASLRPAHSSNQTLCSSVHPIGAALGGTGQWGYKDDYIPHHDPFNYYASTANPHHLTVASVGGVDTLSGLASIGHDTQSYVNGQPQFDTPNHQYDMSDFDQLVAAIQSGQLPPSALPAVSFIKAPGYQDGHAAYSDPADEQQFITNEINALMKTPDWSSTAVIINYDDSDGWYDHQAPPIVNPSLSPADNLVNTTLTGATSGQCGPTRQFIPPLAGEQGRCGLGPRVPMLVISPFARQNYVDHNLSDQSSILNLIEYNWHVPGIAGSADQRLWLFDAFERVPFDLAGMFNFSGWNAPEQLNPVTGRAQR